MTTITLEQRERAKKIVRQILDERTRWQRSQVPLITVIQYILDNVNISKLISKADEADTLRADNERLRKESELAFLHLINVARYLKPMRQQILSTTTNTIRFDDAEEYLNSKDVTI